MPPADCSFLLPRSISFCASALSLFPCKPKCLPSCNRVDRHKSFRIYWTLLNTVGRLLRVPIITCLFRLTHVSHQQCPQPPKCKILECEALRWAELGGYQQPKCYDMGCHTQIMDYRPTDFRDRENYRWDLPKYANSPYVPTPQDVSRRLEF